MKNDIHLWEGLMDVMFWVWLGIIVVTTVLEFATMDTTSIWFTAGALIPFILSAVGGISWIIQVVLFVALSCLFIVLLRPLAKKYLLKGVNHKTNTEAYIGKQYKLLTGYDGEELGSVKINGVVWGVVSKTPLDKDTLVKVIEIDGNKLVVEKVNKEGK